MFKFTGVLPVVAVYSANTVSEHSWWYLSEINIKFIKKEFWKQRQIACGNACPVLSSPEIPNFKEKKQNITKQNNVSTDIAPVEQRLASSFDYQKKCQFGEFHIILVCNLWNFFIFIFHKITNISTSYM